MLTIAADLVALLAMTIRVHDVAYDQRYADRFNRRFEVRPGESRVMIPMLPGIRQPRSLFPES